MIFFENKIYKCHFTNFVGKDPILFNTYHLYWHNFFTLLHSCGTVNSEISKTHIMLGFLSIRINHVGFGICLIFPLCSYYYVQPTSYNSNSLVYHYIIFCIEPFKHCFFAIICSVCYLLMRTPVFDHLTFLTFNLHIRMFVYVLYCK